MSGAGARDGGSGTPARAGVWVAVGTLDDIPREGARTLDVAGTRIAVFRTAEDRVFALEDRCPHRGGPLSQGIVHGNCVTCPLHNLVVALDTGVAGDEGAASVRRVRLDGRRVLLDATPAGADDVADATRHVAPGDTGRSPEPASSASSPGSTSASTRTPEAVEASPP